MARLTGPLFSLGASGSIGKTLVFAKWKGIDYVRRHVVPENPNTVGQQEVRGIFSTLCEMWKRMGAGPRSPFELAVRGLPLTPRNRHIQANAAALQGEADLDNLVMSLAGGNAINMANIITADGADGTVSITCDAPATPPGYTLLEVEGAAVEDGDPSPVLIRTTYFDAEDAAPYAFSIDVPTDGDYQVGIWAAWRRDSDQLVFTSIADRTQVAVTGN